ncbi:MAG: Uma2 family endonuclease [Thermoguttaceae bacterium]
MPMSTVADVSPPMVWITVADLFEQLGHVPQERVLLVPTPGTATEKDVLDLIDHSDRICELVDGVLVEKTMGYLESMLAGAILELLRGFVRKRKLGIVLGADGTLKILRNQVRIPDVCFISWDRFPGGRLPKTPIPAVAPDLAVEVLSDSNTEGEMRRKLQDYFTAGVRLVWYVDPRTRTASAYTSPEHCTVFDENGVLTGGDVLPGFELPLRELFVEMDAVG